MLDRLLAPAFLVGDEPELAMRLRTQCLGPTEAGSSFFQQPGSTERARQTKPVRLRYGSDLLERAAHGLALAQLPVDHDELDPARPVLLIEPDRRLEGRGRATVAEEPDQSQTATVMGRYSVGLSAEDLVEAGQRATIGAGVQVSERRLFLGCADELEYVYKETKDFIGWDILGGAYAPEPYTDPFTGTRYSLLNQLETPTIQKGNGPFLTSNIEALLPESPRYRSDYHGVFLTFNKRYADGWSLAGSYTWSRSQGLLPNSQSQGQYNPLYGSTRGSWRIT